MGTESAAGIQVSEKAKQGIMEYREVLRNIGERILTETRTELYLSMHFLGPALGNLSPVMDLSTTTVGTDAAYIRFNPKCLMTKYIEHPFWLKRVYLHMLLHCLFRHMFAWKQQEDGGLFGLCCDIAVESVIDSMEIPAIARPISEKRSAWYEKLRKEAGILSAQRLYRYFTSGERDYTQEALMESEFGMDDHSFWERLDPQDIPKNSGEQTMAAEAAAPLIATKRLNEEEWKKLANKVRLEMTLGREAGTRTGSFLRYLQYDGSQKTDYREFLKRFAVTREESFIDPDSFDYGFYNYGMQLYGNMPLIEENEYREATKVEQLIIVLDTSASCQDFLVQEFLNETASMLLRGDYFFTRTRIHIIECDDRVQNDIEITELSQMEEYAKHFCLKGGFGTDFRPAFAYVEELRRQKKIEKPRGLMYFTDGKGIYPKKQTDYDTAFVFVKNEDPDTSGVPAWAMKLFI